MDSFWNHFKFVGLQFLKELTRKKLFTKFLCITNPLRIFNTETKSYFFLEGNFWLNLHNFHEVEDRGVEMRYIKCTDNLGRRKQACFSSFLIVKANEIFFLSNYKSVKKIFWCHTEQRVYRTWFQWEGVKFDRNFWKMFNFQDLFFKQNICQETPSLQLKPLIW